MKLSGTKIAVSAAVALLAAVPSAQARDLIYSTWVSAEHHLTRNVVVPFTDELREKTGGEVNFEVVTGGALAGGRETLTAIENGTVDAGYVVDIYTPSALPQTAFLAGLSLLISDAVAATAAMNETVLLDCEECLASFQDHNVQPLGFVSTSTYALMCTSPVTGLADLAGKKVRASSAWTPLIGELGGVAVNTATSELYEAMQRGAVDCSVGPLAHLPSYSLYEVVKGVNTMPIGAYAGGLSLNMSKGAWDEMTPENRRVALDLTSKYVASGIYGYLEGDAEALTEAKTRGIAFVDPSQDIVDAYASYNTALIEQLIAKGKEDPAIKDAETLVNTFAANLDKWKEIVAGLDGSSEAFAKALNDEIYSKLN